MAIYEKIKFRNCVIWIFNSIKTVPMFYCESTVRRYPNWGVSLNKPII